MSSATCQKADGAGHHDQDASPCPEVVTVEDSTIARSPGAEKEEHLDHEQARQLAAHYDPDSPEERALVRKLDWRLVVRFSSFHYSSEPFGGCRSRGSI